MISLHLLSLINSLTMKKRAKALNVVWYFHNPAINGWVMEKSTKRALAHIHELIRVEV